MTAARRPRVLLIEEDAQHRERLRSELQAEGIDVVGGAGDGRKGIWLAHAMLPEVVLISRWLPVLDGFEVTRRIKEIMPTAQVIIQTRAGEPPPSHTAMDVGAYAYVVKGCSPKLIRDMVFRVWDVHRELLRALGRPHLRAAASA